MLILFFGTRTVSTKIYSGKQLGFTDPQLINQVFAKRISYFHIFWIPFFPFGKHWGLVRADGSIVPVDTATSEILSKSAGKVKTPFYTFLGFLVGALIGASFPLYFWHENKSRIELDDRVYLDTKEEIMNHVNNPKIGDVFQVEISPNCDTARLSYNIYSCFEVTGVSDTSVQFSTPTKDPCAEHMWSVPGDAEKAFADSVDNNPFWIRKSAIESSMPADYMQSCVGPIMGAKVNVGDKKFLFYPTYFTNEHVEKKSIQASDSAGKDSVKAK